MKPVIGTALLGVVSLLLSTTPATALDLGLRQHIFIVGSSTAYPIVSAAAERVARDNAGVTPVVESTGTGGGLKLFCSGAGLETPDIAMASRRMKDSERETCARNQVNDVREIKIGYDGIVVANAKGSAEFRLGKIDIYRALARELPAQGEEPGFMPNPYRTWREVNPALPDMPILVFGPPPTSGTRDILVERLLEDGCMEDPRMRALHDADPGAFVRHCQSLREDGAFVDAGENDARMVRKLLAAPEALGILGYNFLDRNRDRLQAATIDGVKPEFELIESGVYPLSRPLFIYVKPQHSRLVPGLDDFIAQLLSPRMSGPDGWLIEQGLIPLTAADRAAQGAL